MFLYFFILIWIIIESYKYIFVDIYRYYLTISIYTIPYTYVFPILYIIRHISHIGEYYITVNSYE